MKQKEMPKVQRQPHAMASKRVLYWETSWVRMGEAIDHDYLVRNPLLSV